MLLRGESWKESAMTREPNPFQPRILLVDDNPTLLNVLAETLSMNLKDIVVEKCPSGSDALGHIATTEYDVIVSDVLMPDVHGLELLERVRAMQPNTLVILITGADDRELTLRALRGGAYDFIMKPVSADHFCASISRAIELRGLKREVELQQIALRRHAEELESTVEERTRDLLEAHRLKDEFLATISHELRTPLTAILGWARLLCQGGLDDESRDQAIESVARNARSQAQLIDDLLDMSRIITGKLRLDVQNVDLYSALDAAFSAVLPAAQAKNIEIVPVFDRDIGVVAGDPERLQQIFWNLLSNAIKFTPEGGRVEVRLSRVGSQVAITVSDNGCGICPEFLPFVFDRLRQGDPSQPGARRGLGLGLAIVRHLVELHGGTVRGSSDGPGAGSQFTVMIPSRRVEALVERPAGTPATSQSRVLRRERPPCLAGIHALVIDDEPDTRHVLKVTLERAGAQVSSAATAAEGLEAFRRRPPDVLLCDIGLPDEDGYWVISKVRQLPQSRGGRVPAIALTAYARTEDRRQALSAGFHLHLPKPGPADLAGIVAGLVERCARRRVETADRVL
jgi:signal transduction histidine kinase